MQGAQGEGRAAPAREDEPGGAREPLLLLVSDPAESGDIARLLAAEGFAAPLTGSGDDDTLALYEEARPDVLVVAAGLQRGDARSLIAAVRSGRHGPPAAVVLLGEDAGPVRTLVDAADFEIDRFVPRPLAPAVLGDAVRACAAADADGVPRPIDPEVSRELTRRRIAEATDRAIESFVDDALHLLEAGGPLGRPPASDPEPPRPDPGDAPVEDPSPDEPPVEDPSPDEPPVEDPPPDEPPAEDPPPGEPPREDPPPEGPPVEDPPPEEPPRDDPPGDEPPVRADDTWSLPPPQREPTLILTGGESAERQRRERAAELADELADEEEPGLPPMVAERAEDRAGDPAAGDSVLDAPLDASLDDLEHAATPEVGLDAEDPPSGGAFARELRRKMSAMAERLFPGQTPAPSFDIRPAHDAHTEIDFASLGDTAVALAGDELATGATFLEERTGETAAGEGDTREVTTARRAAGTPHRGRLGGADGDIARLLGRWATTEFTGRVELRHEGEEKTLWLESGRPVFVSSNLPQDRMGDLLFREGKITRAQHAECCELVAESGRRMGEILVELGFLKPRELLPAVRRHLEDLFYSLFGWEQGEYEAVSGSPGDERIRLSRHPAAMVFEGVRRKYELPRLEDQLGASSAVLRTRAPEALSAILGVADLSPVERAAVDLFDGQRSVAEVAAAGRMDLTAVYQLAHALVALDVAELIDRGAASAEVAERGPSLVGETDLAIDRQRVRAKHQIVEEGDYFMLLGVRRDATRFEIQRAYESVRRDYAAESFPAELSRELEVELGEIAEMVDEAYDVLADDALRSAYRGNLRD